MKKIKNLFDVSKKLITINPNFTLDEIPKEFLENWLLTVDEATSDFTNGDLLYSIFMFGITMNKKANKIKNNIPDPAGLENFMRFQGVIVSMLEGVLPKEVASSICMFDVQTYPKVNFENGNTGELIDFEELNGE